MRAAEPTTGTTAPLSRWVITRRRFVRHRAGMVALVVLMLIVLVAIVGPLVWHYGYADITPALSEPPSGAHPFGTDTLGHDMLALVMRGMQQSLLIAFSVAVVAGITGVILGVVSGYFGGVVDATVMRLVDLVLTLPSIALAAFLASSFSGSGVSWVGIALVLGALMWTHVARLVRGVILSLREQPYIEAARVMGASPFRIMVRHLIPNVADHIIVSTTLLVGVAILAESGLSFIGFGVRPPDTSLGLLVANAVSAVLTRPWMFYFPGLLIILIVLAVNYVGEGLRDSFNPKSSPINPLQNVRRRLRTPLTPLPAKATDLLTIARLRVTFASSSRPAISRIDLTIARGEVLALVGESGSGKSMTSLAIAGLLPANAVQEGQITFDGHELTGLDYSGWRQFRGKRIATILQDPSTSLNPVLTIGAQFEESFRVAGPVSARDCRRRAVELMGLVAITRPADRLRQYPHQLSGGMRQRVVIAMAMIHSPDLIIADEPTTALDVTVQAQVIAALGVARKATGSAMLFITHDLALVAGIADRVAVMREGEIVEVADVMSIFSSPKSEYTKRLLELAPRLGDAAAIGDAR
jgi:ABC-type dipeptide/oligopeptide/nickel transport system ATPase component/ABC-type dipeptide/oligopeptide/nickel transport system permease subunit